ncbi:MAG: outer membrane protein [Candidatus Rokuibacteriota bacterium]
MASIRGGVAGLLLSASLVTLAVEPAQAEWMFDLYGGASRTRPADLRVTGTDDTGASVDGSLSDVEPDTGFTAGLRGGYWLESLPFLGFGLDLFYFEAPVPAQTTTATAAFSGELLGKPIAVSAAGDVRIPSVTLPGLGFAPEVYLRLPLLVSASYPRGRLQPYITGGPAFAFSLDNEEVELQVGGKIGGGLAVYLFKALALFAEYRYTFFPDFALVDRDLEYKVDLDTHHVVVGLSLRF